MENNLVQRLLEYAARVEPVHPHRATLAIRDAAYVASLKKDAARWRWWRSPGVEGEGLSWRPGYDLPNKVNEMQWIKFIRFLRHPDLNLDIMKDVPIYDQLDAAIDKVIAGKAAYLIDNHDAPVEVK